MRNLSNVTECSSQSWENTSVLAPSPGTGVDYLRLHPELSYVYLVGLLLQMVLGNAGNALVIGSVAVDRRLRKESNILILNLALADLCVTGKCTYTHNIHTQTRTHIIITLPLAISASRVSAHTRTTYTHKHAHTSSSPCPRRSLRHG